MHECRPESGIKEIVIVTLFDLLALIVPHKPKVAAGIVDPVKVTRSALQNAASIASMILSTNSLIVEKKEKSKRGGDSHDQDDDCSSAKPTDEGRGRNLPWENGTEC